LDVEKGLQINGPILPVTGFRSVYHLVATGVPGEAEFGLKIYQGDFRNVDSDMSGRKHLLTITGRSGHVRIGPQEGPIYNWLEIPSGGVRVNPVKKYRGHQLGV
jgi:hypothetical protein